MNKQIALKSQQNRVSPTNWDDLREFLQWVFLEKGSFFGFEYPTADDTQRKIGTRLFAVLLWTPFFILGIGNIVQSLFTHPDYVGPSLGVLLLCLIGCVVTGWLGKFALVDLKQYIHVLIIATCGVPAFGTLYLFSKLFLNNTIMSVLNDIMLIPFHFAVFLLIGLTDLSLGVVKIAGEGNYVGDAHVKDQMRSIVSQADSENARRTYLLMPLFVVGKTTHLCIASILGGISWGVLSAYHIESSSVFVSIILNPWPLFKVMLPLVVGITSAAIVRSSLEQPARLIPVVALLCIPIAYISMVIFLALSLF